MSQWIDLTHPLDTDCPTRPPTRPTPEFEPYAAVERDGYNGTRLHLDTHCGTHMDAPTHFLPPEEAATIDDIEPSEMITEGVILDFTDTGPSERISKAALKTEAERYGVQAGDVVILFLGFDEPIVSNSVLPLRGVCDDERLPPENIIRSGVSGRHPFAQS